MDSPLKQQRIHYQPHLPRLLEELKKLEALEQEPTTSVADHDTLKALFPHTYGQPTISFAVGSDRSHTPLRVGVVLSGGQAPGGHNVICGLFDALRRFHADSRLFGFLGGPSGVIENQVQELTGEILASYRNTGGFDLIGSGRTKIEMPEQLEAALHNVEQLKLDGLVIIGGDDSNTNAALLAEFFLTRGAKTHVVGVPKTIDGDLKNALVEIPFGFDTACKVYSEMIGNIARDALSAKKYTHFIKLMGRSASHITLECALQCHPNIALIGEEIAQKQLTLADITKQITDILCQRAAAGKNYGVVLIPEGLIEFVPEVKLLISELNTLLANGAADPTAQLSDQARKTFTFLPEKIQQQLLIDRDPHGNVQVSHIATEELFIHTVKEALKQRKDYSGTFTPVSHFFGYEGRSGFPSNFDTQYCYALGFVAAALIDSGHTGYMGALTNLTAPPEEWNVAGFPITMMLCMEERKGKQKPVIQKALVDLAGEPFKHFAAHRNQWAVEDHYRSIGPIQLYGPSGIVDETTFTLKLEQHTPVEV